MFSIQPFLSRDIFPLKISDKTSFALEMMDEWGVDILPVVDHTIFKGIVHRNQLNKNSGVEAILQNDPKLILPENTQMWKLLEQFQEPDSPLKAVLNSDQEYLGCITPHSILKALNNSYTINSEGLYLRIDIAGRDYSLAQIAHLAESEDVKIMGLWIFGEDPDDLTILIKTNTIQVKGYLSTLKRMGYIVAAQRNAESDESIDEDRYGLLMKYLDL